MSRIDVLAPIFIEGMGSVLAPPSSLIVPPRPWDEVRPGKCYNNVLEMIRRHGGEAVFGWALTDFGPHRPNGGSEPPLYRRWLNHVVWRDPQGALWEVSPNSVIDSQGARDHEFRATEFLVDASATFEIESEEEWRTRPSRYVAVRPEGDLVCSLLTQAQYAIGDEARTYWLREALAALVLAGLRPREWRVETIGERTGSIWLIAE
jgi:hypothetical protein